MTIHANIYPVSCNPQTPPWSTPLTRWTWSPVSPGLASTVAKRLPSQPLGSTPRESSGPLSAESTMSMEIVTWFALVLLSVHTRLCTLKMRWMKVLEEAVEENKMRTMKEEKKEKKIIGCFIVNNNIVCFIFLFFSFFLNLIVFYAASWSFAKLINVLFGTSLFFFLSYCSHSSFKNDTYGCFTKRSKPCNSCVYQ